MKFKVRGLVFVGFAAAILSANAMAASDNTVTSKSYVDTHFQNVADKAQDLTATGDAAATQYPSVAAVKTALQETGATVQSGTLTVTQNGETIGTFSANQATNSPVTLALTDTTYSADGTTITKDANNQFSANTTGGVAENGTNLVTGGAVYDALHNTANVGNGALTVTVDGGTVTGSFAANQAAGSTIAITGLESLSNKQQTIDTNATAEEKAANYPSQAAVESYVTNAVSAEANVQANWTETNTTSDAYIQNKPTLGTASAADVSTNGVANGETGLTTGDQVYDYVQSQTNGQVLPMPSSCTATNPCALITDGTSGSPMWVPIAQAEASVGTGA